VDRAAAIEALRARGFHANERRWALGDSIFVGAAPTESGAIRAYRVGTYIYPVEERRAVIVDPRVPALVPDAEFTSLEDAVACASEFMHREIAKLKDQ
jgi:hypothetical protein